MSETIEGPVACWTHRGVVLPRGAPGDFDDHITGDPCIVFDSHVDTFRMFYFGQTRSEDGEEVNVNAQALCKFADDPGPGSWEKCGPVTYTNPELVEGRTHKAWILIEALKPAIPACIKDLYYMFTVTYEGNQKVIHVATCKSLEGPWEIRSEPILMPGDPAGPSGYQVDTVTAYWFADRKVALIIYKEYPKLPQRGQLLSQYGSSTAAATYNPTKNTVSRICTILEPGAAPWLAGWTGGMQLIPAKRGGWWGLTSGSPSPPLSPQNEPYIREPGPSLGGWAYTEERWPVNGWRASENPIVHLEDLDESQKNQGERMNLWRHHLLLLADGRCYLYYNAGPYGQEQMFCREGRWSE